MRLLQLTVPFVLLTFATAAGWQGSGDAVAERLLAEKQRYDTKLSAARATLLEALVVDATDGAPPVDSARMASDRLVFETRGVLPASVPAASRDYEQTRRECTARLWRAFSAAEVDYRASALHELADGVRAEAAKFEPTYEQARWSDLRLRAVLDAEGGPKWAETGLWFDGAAQRVLRVRPPAPKTGAGFRLRFELTRTAGAGAIQVLFPRADLTTRGLGLLILGGFGGQTNGFELIDGLAANQNLSRVDKDVLPPGRARAFELEALPSGALVRVDGEELVAWSEPSRLTLPDGVARMYRQDKGTIYIVVPAGTSVRLDQASWIEVPAPSLGASEPSPRAREIKAPPPDQLALGSAFVGTWFDEKWCRVEVVERDRGRCTAALRVTGEKLAVCRVEVTTNSDGSTFKIKDIRMVKPSGNEPHATIDFSSGSGSVARQKLEMSWRARVERPGYRGSWNTSVVATSP